MNAIVIESHDNDGVKWGVSVGSHNPEPYEYIECGGRDEAFALRDKLTDIRCPKCGSSDIIGPALRCPWLTCEPCGRDFFFDRFGKETVAGRWRV